eukprot:TRINITY_DN19842_c2_g1_i1.p1 TRINITY_DN19842_c2_g1~~TRINITY_DN19842_c2_g1_i1.p1  ORF type:complete len:185 (+),score=33.96 TRINITY_DN19842_c2_g1_i1:245-799(+)
MAALRPTRTLNVIAGVGVRETLLYQRGKAPTNYKTKAYGLQEDRRKIPTPKDMAMWKVHLRNNPRMMSWERPETPSHLTKYHRPDVNWDKVRYQYLVVDKSEWPTINLSSEDMYLKDVEDWRETNRFQLEGEIGNLRQRVIVPVPNNYNIVQRHMRCSKHALMLKERARTYPKYHPKEDELLDF